MLPTLQISLYLSSSATLYVSVHGSFSPIYTKYGLVSAAISGWPGGLQQVYLAPIWAHNSDIGIGLTESL